MGRADLTLSNGVLPNTHADRPLHGVYLDRRMRGVRDRDVSCCAEQRLYIDGRAAHPDSVENSSRPRNGDGREYAQDAERDGELEKGEGVPHVSFPQVGWLDRI
jgi:hypothetical protein